MFLANSSILLYKFRILKGIFMNRFKKIYRKKKRGIAQLGSAHRSGR